MIERTISLIACLLCLAATSPTEAAESGDLHPYLENVFVLDLGIFYPDRQLDLQVNGTVGDNRKIDFNKQVRLKNTDETFAAEIAWRFRGKWSIRAQYFKSADSTRTVLEEDIEWGNLVFGAGSNATAGADFSLTRILLGRHLNIREAHDIGIGGGFHWLNLGSFIEADVLVNGIPVATMRSVSAEAPLPNIGAWYKYSMSPRWALKARADLLSADVGRYDGIMVNFAVGVNYQVFEHFGIGVNFNYFELDVGVDKGDWRGDIETIYDGIYVYASLYY